jgi:hypothetical protein
MSGFDLNNETQMQLRNLNPLNLLNNYEKFMVLKIYVDEATYPGLKQKYISHASNHNNKILNSSNCYLDAGFDILNPERKTIHQNNQLCCTSYNNNIMSVINKFDFAIICSAQTITCNKIFNSGYYMYPRSSLSKTKLRLANATGIIDAGYRGNLIGMFDIINLSSTEEYTVEKYDRLLQICAPSLEPIVVEIVNTPEQLGEQTLRGSCGFGSTGH